jgi:hypothetical protein
MTIFSRRAVLLASAVALAPRAAFAAPMRVTVHKDPGCGCCNGWVDHLRANGFAVKTVNTTTLDREKSRLGVPNELAACHTAEVSGYVVEGHVPAAAIKKLLAEKPKATGLAVPGMPQGSPGMGGTPEQYDVILFGKGEQRVFGRYQADKPLPSS